MIEVKVGQTWALGPPGGDVITFYVQRLEERPTRTGQRTVASQPYAYCTVGATGNTKWIPVRSLQTSRYRLVRDEHGKRITPPAIYQWVRGSARRPWLLNRDGELVADLTNTEPGIWWYRVFDGQSIIDSGDCLPYRQARAEAEAVARHIHDQEPLPSGVTLD